MYIPDWEPLNVALRRLVAIGLSEDDAKADLCNVIADEQVDIRVLVGGDDFFAGRTVKRRQVIHPVRLKPSDFDWEESRPVAKWNCGDRSLDWDSRPIKLLELRTSDLEDLFPQSTTAKLESQPIANRPRMAGASIEPKFREWRERRGDDIPTEAEDIAYMKQFGVGRDAVRTLRLRFPRRQRGQKRSG
ncbi:hypothetical protein [Bradyrhizobium sp. LA7.1]|uniref:hypothetical protein n=1 Tax=Bradyrhizobium sp. LA7.1 TaxID=3156324 RepID=UPI00339109F8